MRSDRQADIRLVEIGAARRQQVRRRLVGRRRHRELETFRQRREALVYPGVVYDHVLREGAHRLRRPFAAGEPAHADLGLV
jgi:hypothetical protein